MSSAGNLRKTALAPLILRDSTEADIPSIAAIYDHAVKHGTASFETEPPGPEEMKQRRLAIVQGGFPYLVAERDGALAGYCYAGPYHKRYGYRFTVENSVYVGEDFQKQGVGSALLGELIARCERAGFRTMVAAIGDSNNHASIHLHEAHGFRHTGLLPAVGWKFGNWLDVVFMTRTLGEGATTPPGSG